MQPQTEHEDEAKIINLNADQKAVALRAIVEAGSALRYAGELLSKGKTPYRDLYNPLYVAEGQLVDLCKAAGVELDGVNQREERFSMVRAANARVHELERLLGAGVTAQAVKAGLTEYERKVRAWWETKGLGYVSKIHFAGHGAELTLSCLLRSVWHSLSDTPVTDKLTYDQWLAKLEAQGYELVRDDGRGDEVLADTPKARENLTHLITQHLPSARILNLRSMVSRKQRVFTLREIEVFVDDLEDFSRLGSEEKAAQAA